MKMVRSIIYLLSFLAISSCGDSEEASEDGEAVEEVLVEPEAIAFEGALKVSDDKLMLAEQPGVLLTAGFSDKQRLLVSLVKANIQEDYAVISEANNEPSIVITAYWDHLAYVQSVDHQTSVNFTITNFDDTNLIAGIKLSASLVNPDTDEVLIITESKLEVAGRSFLLLTGADSAKEVAE